MCSKFAFKKLSVRLARHTRYSYYILDRIFAILASRETATAQLYPVKGFRRLWLADQSKPFSFHIS